MILQSQANLDAAKELAKSETPILNSTIVLCTQLCAELAIKSMIFLDSRHCYDTYRNHHSLTKMTTYQKGWPNSVNVLAKNIEQLGIMPILNYCGKLDDLSIRARYPKYFDVNLNTQIVPTTVPILAFKDVNIKKAIRFS